MQVAPEAQAAPERPEEQVRFPSARGLQYDPNLACTLKITRAIHGW